MQFTTTLFATLAAFATLAIAAPHGFDDFGVIPFDVNRNVDDNQNNNINQNDNANDNEQFQFNEFERFSAISSILDAVCRFDGDSGELQFLGKRSDLVKRSAGFRGLPGFENFDFNNNQNANVNQNANLDENFLQSFNSDHTHGDFLDGFSRGSFSNLIDCFFNDDGVLAAGKR